MPLECATYDGDIDMICALLASGANPDTKLSSGMSCRTIAHKQGLIEAIKLFDQVTARNELTARKGDNDAWQTAYDTTG